MDMSDIEWMDEPPPTERWDSAHRRRVQQFAEQLRQNPGKWTIYPWTSSESSARAMASRISRGKVQAFAEGFQAVSRRGATYVRYEGVDE